MTRKFKKAVKAVVADGVITPEEREILAKLAKDEVESEVEIELYITKELKKRKNKIARGPHWLSRNGAALLAAAVTLGGPVLKFYLDSKGKGK